MASKRGRDPVLCLDIPAATWNDLLVRASLKSTTRTDKLSYLFDVDKRAAYARTRARCEPASFCIDQLAFLLQIAVAGRLPAAA